jgi:hypothetical protein
LPKLTQARAESILGKRFADACDRATPEAIAGDHEWQLKVLTCASQNVICICSRRAGKSELACGILLRTAMATAGVSCIYLGLTKDSAGIIWRKFKKLKRKLDFPMELLDSDQLAILPNGSRVLFTGTDDTRRVTHLLGDQLSGGVAVIDECQDDPGIMERTVEDVLGPMLDETTVDLPVPGRLVLLGTVPDVPAGYFWRTWERNFTGPQEVTPAHSVNEDWACFSWSRFQNPFETNNETNLTKYIRKYKYERSDPEVLRRWHGLRVFSKDSNAYRFQPAKHTYQPPSGTVESDVGPFRCRFAPVLPGVRHFIVGIDQAQRQDRFAIICWGWNPDDKDHVWHVAEAVTGFGADPQDSEWLAVCKELKRRYGGSMEFIRDAGGSSAPVNDALQLSHGISIVSAIKGPGSLKARVQRLADLLNKGVAKVMADSELALDLLTAKWSMQAREKGKWELDKTAKSPDLADAATYAFDLPSYTQIGYKPAKPLPRTEADWLREQREKTLRDLLNGKTQARPKPNPSLIMWQPPPRAQ